MAAPTTHSARAPEAEGSLVGLNEPSMEDILASIRRIIAEDQSNNLGRSGLGGLTRRTPAPVPGSTPVDTVSASDTGDAVPPPSDESATHAGPQGDPLASVYETPGAAPPSYEDVAEDSSFPPESETHEASDARVSAATPGVSEPMHDAPATEWASSLVTPPMAHQEIEPLMSASTGASITSSFQSLAESMVLQDPDLIERVMREAMRPLLKAWLDDHLPSIVERLVRTEIERVARGGRARGV